MARPETPDIRWRQRFQSFRKAFGQLHSAAELAKQRKLSDLEHGQLNWSGLIQR
jgi:hypothetical protein